MSHAEWLIRDNLAVSDLSRVIPWLVVLRFEHSTLWIRAEQRNHSAMAAIRSELYRLHRSRQRNRQSPWGWDIRFSSTDTDEKIIWRRTTLFSSIIGFPVLRYSKDYWKGEQKLVERWKKQRWNAIVWRTCKRGTSLSDYWWAVGTEMDGQTRGSHAYHTAWTCYGGNWEERQSNKSQNQETSLYCAIQQKYESGESSRHANQFLGMSTENSKMVQEIVLPFIWHHCAELLCHVQDEQRVKSRTLRVSSSTCPRTHWRIRIEAATDDRQTINRSSTTLHCSSFHRFYSRK